MITVLSRIESCILLYCVLLHSWISALYLYSLLRGPPGDRTENGRFRDQVLFLGGTQRSVRAWKELSISRLTFDLVSFFLFQWFCVSVSLLNDFFLWFSLYYDEGGFLVSTCTVIANVMFFLFWITYLLRKSLFSPRCIITAIRSYNREKRFQSMGLAEGMFEVKGFTVAGKIIINISKISLLSHWLCNRHALGVVFLGIATHPIHGTLSNTPSESQRTRATNCQKYESSHWYYLNRLPAFLVISWATTRWMLDKLLSVTHMILCYWHEENCWFGVDWRKLYCNYNKL